MPKTAFQKRDKGGNLKVELDPVRARDSYSVAATNFSGAAGVQIFTNASGLPLYLNRIYLKENSANAGILYIYDGTVAGGTLIFAASFTSGGSLNLENLGIKPATSTNGIYLRATVSTSCDVTVSIYKDPNVTE